LQQSIAVMTRELGRAPRAIAWPYGRYTQSAVEVATALGFRFALTFDPEPALASRPLAIARFSLSTGSLLPQLVERLQAGDMLPRVRRFVRLRPSSLWRPDPAETERLLGAAIERVRILGATAIVIDAVEPGPDGRPAAWFPTRLVPGDGLTWKPVDDERAEATLTDGPTTVSLEFRFDDHGDLVELYSPGRFRDVNGTSVPTPWRVRALGQEVVGGVRMMTPAVVEWVLPDGPMQYWRGKIRDVKYTY